MDSVRYLSYHQWRGRKQDVDKATSYHQTLSSNVENLEANVTFIDKLIAGYLDAMKAFCEAGSHLADAFSTVLKQTPLLEITQQLKQVVEEIDHVAHKSSVHITNHILATLCEFTSTFPGLRRAIEAHKRNAQNYESCFENLEVLEKDESQADSKRLKIAKKRFRSANEELSSEEEKLYRSFSEVEENRVKMLGACFLSLLQVQSQFMTSSAELMTPLGGFEEIGDYLRDREVTLALKDATSTWLSLAQANQGLRYGNGLSRQDIQNLLQNTIALQDNEKKQLAKRVDVLLKNYTREFERAPTPEADIPAGFHRNPKGIELALKCCSSDMERLAAGGFVDVTKPEDMEFEILKQIPQLQLKIGSITHETCPSPSKANDNLKSKLLCIRDLVNTVATHNDIPLNKETLDVFVVTVLYEACSGVCGSAAKTAVQLLFGKVNLITVKPCKENIIRTAHVYVKGTSVHVEVKTAWEIAADSALFSCLSCDVDLQLPLGQVDAIYTAKFSLMDYLEDKERPLPSIYIRRHNTASSPLTPSKNTSSPSHKHNRFRKSLTKATSKIFSRKSGQSSKASGGSSPVVPQSPNHSSSTRSAGTDSGSPGNEGFRISLITTSTDTSNDRDTDIEDPTPLPPPRPKHWARKVQANAMRQEHTDSTSDAGKDEQDDANSNDWFHSDSKFPLPMFKPTPSDSQSQLSLASQQELDEVIKFLSGTPLKRRMRASNIDNISCMTPTDSGLGSTLSFAMSTVTQASIKDSPLPSPRVEITEPEPPLKPEALKEDSGTEVEIDNSEQAEKRAEEIKNDDQSGTKDLEQDRASGEEVPTKIAVSKDSSKESVDQSMEVEASEVEPGEKKEQPQSATTTTKGDKEVAPDGCVTESKAASEVDSPASSPVVVTVSTVDEQPEEEVAKVAISESLRTVWEKAGPKKGPPRAGGSLDSSRPREVYGSQETLYHSCWSLCEFDSSRDKAAQDDEDTKSLNESLLPSNASTADIVDLGLKWSPGFSHHVWSSIPNMALMDEVEGPPWYRSDETLNRVTTGGKNVFSLGLGITGPELIAAAHQAGRGEMPGDRALVMPGVSKTWSTEDLREKDPCDPWPARSSSPTPQWSKSSSLSENTRKTPFQRQALPHQHYSDPFLPREQWWSHGEQGFPHPRYQQQLQRQFAMDANYHQGTAPRGRPPMGHSAFHPVQPGFPKPVRPSHLQVPPHYPASPGNHHNSNPRF